MSDGVVGRIPRTPSTVVRPILDTDIDHLLQVQHHAYEQRYWESAESFRAKVIAGAGSCCGAWNDGTMLGYLIALPLADNTAPSLNSVELPAVAPDTATTMFIHDLAVLPDHRGAGLADVLLVHLYESALRRNIEQFRLISVQESQPFWQSRGFVVEPDPVPPGYGPEAVLMSRR